MKGTKKAAYFVAVITIKPIDTTIYWVYNIYCYIKNTRYSIGGAHDDYDYH